MSIKDYLVTALSYLRQPGKRKLIGLSYRLRGKKGLEIGGPSSQFSLRGNYPVYVFAKQVDGVNFSNETIWEGAIREGQSYRYHHKTGYQYIREATSLKDIPDGSYDFILSCHSLEHVANPLQAVNEWKRVLKPGGWFLLILPDKEYTFDVNRPYTTMAHLLADEANGTDEHDTTHLKEILELHEISRDPDTGSKERLAALLQENYTNRRAHHHVFSLNLVAEMLEHASFRIVHQQKAAPFHLITVAQKGN